MTSPGLPGAAQNGDEPREIGIADVLEANRNAAIFAAAVSGVPGNGISDEQLAIYNRAWLASMKSGGYVPDNIRAGLAAVLAAAVPVVAPADDTRELLLAASEFDGLAQDFLNHADAAANASSPIWAGKSIGMEVAARMLRERARKADAAASLGVVRAPDETPGEHRMIPGSHERTGNAQCVCGAPWIWWAGRCSLDPAAGGRS